ncbi:transposase-like protein [Corynebacterium striatum]
MLVVLDQPNNNGQLTVAIAHAGLSLPESPRMVDRVDEVFLKLKILNGIDEDGPDPFLVDT